MPPPRAILVTAFEPSGDALAAGLIAELKRQRPEITIHALGGPKMAAAGATIIETTTEDAVMLGGAIKHARVHMQRVKRLRAWLRANPIDALVPTDSPAANWAICKAVRKIQPKAKIVHLAAPQVWAWASWRIRKLRRLTDHVLCMLPFEPEWFGQRGVPATFVGHPIFEAASAKQRAQHSPADASNGRRLALLPGSRKSEWERNWKTMLQATEVLRRKHPSLSVSVAASSGKAFETLKNAEHFGDSTPTRQFYEAAMSDEGAEGIFASTPWLTYYRGKTDEVIAEADVVLVVSGTATLQVASHRKPMVALYNVSRLTWNFLGRWIVATRTFTLPNLISEADGNGRVIPELVPHFGDVNAVVEAVDALLRDGAARAKQREGLDRVCSHFEGKSFGKLATAKFLEVIEG